MPVLIVLVLVLLTVVFVQLIRHKSGQKDFMTLKLLQDSLMQGLQETRAQVKDALTTYADETGKRLERLTQTTDTRLREMNTDVTKRVTQGLEKTTETFSDVIKRLAVIDAAQQRITELSGSVLNLQQILTDKKARGAFGEVQLSGLIHNMMPENSFSFQHTLSNGKRADCILFLPPPSGSVAIDAKFPLETFRQITDTSLPEAERKSAEQRFRVDIRRHIQDIAEKYILPPETADGAVMFIPAEAVFAEIHAHYSDLVELAHQSRVWMVSPTTMMAVLTSARAVLKDVAAKKEIHLIQKHISLLATDFARFQKRMENLAKHIELAGSDVKEVFISANKITRQFEQIEKVDLKMDSAPLMDTATEAAE